MRRSVLAIAAVSLLAAGSAQAQSNVSVYGIIDTWVGSQKSGVGASSTTLMGSGGLSGSRWGLQGSEDLGSGLSANFQIEAGYDSSDGSAASPGEAFNRQTWVGLAGGFGEIRLGNTTTSWDDYAYNSNSVFDSGFSPVYYTFVSELDGYPNVRPDNLLKYISPEIGGFTASLTYSLDEDIPGGKTAAFGLSYAVGAFAVAFAYQSDSDHMGAVGIDYDAWNINASYDLGMAVVKGSYARTDDENGDALSAKEWQIGVDVPVTSNITIAAGYARSRDDLASGNKRDAFGLGVSYSLSPRTTMYAGYASGDAESRSTGVKVGDDRLFAVGVRHTF